MKIIFLAHSGFVIEFEDIVLILDYYRDYEKILEDYFNSDEKIIFVSSHSHQDHFNPDIFRLPFKNNPYFVLDESCREKAFKYSSGKDIEFLKDGMLPDCMKNTSIKHLNIFPSTDEGSAILFKTCEGEVFFAGDLNNWDWKDEDTPQMEIDFNKSLNLIEDCLGEESIKVCFFPVDERLEDMALKGALQFLNGIQCEHFFAMHNNGKNIIQKDLEKLISEINWQEKRNTLFHPSLAPGDITEV